MLTTQVLAFAAAGQPSLPPLLPEYYRPVFAVEGGNLELTDQSESNGWSRCCYGSEGEGTFALTLDRWTCEQPACDVRFDAVNDRLNEMVTRDRGSFRFMSDVEMCAEIPQSNGFKRVFIFKLPRAVQVWTVSCPLATEGSAACDYETVRRCVNRQRYEVASRLGNVAMGRWGRCIRTHAEDLFAEGKREKAAAVLEDLLATSPHDYESHIRFAETTADRSAASNSAMIVFRNAESAMLIGKAAKILNIAEEEFEPLSPSETANPSTDGGTSLKVVLIPLPPCNPWLLAQATDLYEQITSLPVEIKRLDQTWIWDEADRVPSQKHVQSLLLRNVDENLDFSGWSRSQYAAALTNAVQAEDAATRFWVDELARSVMEEPGQYLAATYLDRLDSVLKDVRTNGVRTLYVGITEANIYSDDNNYVFSVSRVDGPTTYGIMSYYMMLSDTLQEESTSRQRLVERIAKSLVPASLSQLGIPRSTDPLCPYSYASGVDRLDEKKLELSDPVKVALKKLREPEPH